MATYAWEVFNEISDLDAVYVPIGLGSGVCGTIAARDLLGLTTEIIGVVAENAPSYSLSLKSGRLISTNSANTIADAATQSSKRHCLRYNEKECKPNC